MRESEGQKTKEKRMKEWMDKWVRERVRGRERKGRWTIFGSIGLVVLLLFASLPTGGGLSEAAPVNRTTGTQWDWTIETVDPTSGSGQYASLRLFPSGRNASVAYYDASQGDLKYAYHDGERWNVETVDGVGDAGSYASLALDAQGRPRIAYYNATWGDLKYAAWTGSSWAISTVEDAGDAGQYASLALYDSAWPCIAYYDATGVGALKYAWFDGVMWHKEAVEPIPMGDIGQYASLALDTSGFPHIAYYDETSGDLKYAWKDTGGWHIEVVDAAGNVGSYASLVLDTSGFPHIAYYDVSQGDLKYASYDGTTWHIEVVDAAGNVGRYASLALDASGSPHIAYYDGTSGDLKYAHYDGNAWQFQTVYAPGIVGQYASLSLDMLGRPYIAFYDDTEGNLKWAYFCTPPEASFEVSPAPYCVGSTVTLTNTTVSTWTISYLWDFGDGVTSTLKNPTHAYTESGLFPVILTSSTGCGMDAFSRTLSVWDEPAASFEHSSPACVNLPVHFTSTSQVSGTAFYTWDFGDKTGVVTGTTTPTHIYTATGVYPVVLMVRNECGFDASYENLAVYDVPTASFEHGPNPSCGTVAFTSTASGAVSLLWDFGDGITSTITNPVHAYASGGLYTVTLTAWGMGGCMDMAASVQEVWTGVYGVEMSVIPPSPRPGDVVTFTARAEGTPPIAFTWDFGDGSWGEGSVVTHTYASAGVYTAVVSAVNACGGPVTDTFTVEVCRPVEAVGISGPAALPVGETGFYTATGIPPTATTPITFTWDNGTLGPTAAYSWTLPGTYTVAVSAVNACGGPVTDIFTVEVAPTCTAPSGSSFTWTPLSPSAGEEVTFTGTVGAGTEPFTWGWDFGDGSAQVYGPAVVSHTYATAGTYTVTTAVWNGCGIEYLSGTLEVSSPPVPVFRIYLPLAVRGYCGGDGFEPDNSPSEARPLVLGVPQRRSFHRAWDEDWVYLSLSAGRPYRFWTSELAGGADTRIYLYRDGQYGTPVAQNDDWAGGNCGGTPPNPLQSCFIYIPGETGVYRLKAVQVNGGDIWGCEVRYTLSVSGE